MAQRRGLSVAGALWTVAFASLLLAAVATPAVASSVVSLAVVGHGMTVLALILETPTPSRRYSVMGQRFTLGTFVVMLAAEAFGVVLALGLGESDLAIWFGLGISFALAGFAATWRRFPGDDLFGFQVSFHAILLFPLLAALPAFGLDLWRHEAIAESFGRVTMQLTARIFGLVAIPLLFVTLLTSLAYNMQRPPGERDLAWAVLVAHQAIFLLILFRWTGNAF